MNLQNVNESLKSACALRNEASELQGPSHDDERWKYG